MVGITPNDSTIAGNVRVKNESIGAKNNIMPHMAITQNGSTSKKHVLTFKYWVAPVLEATNTAILIGSKVVAIGSIAQHRAHRVNKEKNLWHADGIKEIDTMKCFVQEEQLLRQFLIPSRTVDGVRQIVKVNCVMVAVKVIKERILPVKEVFATNVLKTSLNSIESLLHVR